MTASSELVIRPAVPGDRDWIRRLMIDEWGAEIVAVHGMLYTPVKLPGFAAVRAGALSSRSSSGEEGGSGERRVGLLTYSIAGQACEIVTLNSLESGQGIGSALIHAMRQFASAAGCVRLWLITTNDNLSAIRFYQKRGFTLVAVHRNAVEASRRLKPEIPLIGLDGIPIRDEIEMELPLEPRA